MYVIERAKLGGLKSFSKFESLCVNCIRSGASKLKPVKLMSTRFVPGLSMIVPFSF